MRLEEFPYSFEKLPASPLLKEEALKWLIDFCYQHQPYKHKPSFLIKTLDKIPTSDNCKPNESIIGVSQQEIRYFVHAYSEPGGSLGIQSYELSTLSDVFLNTGFETHYLSQDLLGRYSNEPDIDSQSQQLLQEYFSLKSEQKYESQQAILQFLTPIPNYQSFMMDVFSEKVQALHNTDPNFLNEIGITELTTRYIEAIKKDDREKIKGLSTDLTIPVSIRAQNLLLDRGYDLKDLSIKPEFNEQTLYDCIQQIEAIAKPYYSEKLQALIDSKLFEQIDRVIFRFPFSRE